MFNKLKYRLLIWLLDDMCSESGGCRYEDHTDCCHEECACRTPDEVDPWIHPCYQDYIMLQAWKVWIGKSYHR